MFKVGDEIIITENYYTFTVKGSKGKIVERKSKDIWEVKFSYIPDGRYGAGESFPIYIEYMALLTPRDPKEEVIKKIKVMEQRYVSRHRSRQPVEGCNKDLVYGGEIPRTVFSVSSPPIE